MSVFVIIIFSVFALSLFSSTPAVVLPDPAESTGLPNGGGQQTGGEYIALDVTVDNVRSAVASLERSESYQRTVTVETFWDGGSASASVNIWTDNGLIRQDTYRDGLETRHVIFSGDLVYVWYGTGSRYFSGPLGAFTSDSEQGIPTYEDLVALDQSALTGAGFVEKNGFGCVYAEAKDDSTGYVRRFWVDVSSGLLVLAETEKNGTLVYRMTSQKISGISAAESVFKLPDGTVLSPSSEA